MTLARDSKTAAHAQRYAKLLRSVMKERGIGFRHLAKQMGVSEGTLGHVREAQNLPGLGLGLELAAALDSPALGELIVQIRTQECSRPTCPVTFVNPGRGDRKYCSDHCRRAMTKRRDPDSRARAFAAEEALAETDVELNRTRMAVMAMCRECEPEGACRIADCPLRPVSPLPLVAVREVGVARPYSGFNDADRERVREIHAAANKRRFFSPEARARASRSATAQRARQRAAHAGEAVS